MKRFLLLLATLVLIVGVVAGCSGEVKTYVDSDETITVSVGEEFQIALDRDAVVDYRWDLAYDHTMLRLTDEKYEASEGEKPSGLSGEGGTKYYRFRAEIAGDTVIELGYKRPQDTELTDAKIFNISIK